MEAEYLCTLFYILDISFSHQPLRQIIKFGDLPAKDILYVTPAPS